MVELFVSRKVRFVLLAMVALTIGGGRAVAQEEARKIAIPHDAVLTYLVHNTLIAFNNANLTGNYSVFHELCAPRLVAQTTAKTFHKSFTRFREDAVNLEEIVTYSPKLTVDPIINEDGFLFLKGYYATSPYETHFDLAYDNVGDRWRLLSIEVDLRLPDDAVLPNDSGPQKTTSSQVSAPTPIIADSVAAVTDTAATEEIAPEKQKTIAAAKKETVATVLEETDAGQQKTKIPEAVTIKPQAVAAAMEKTEFVKKEQPAKKLPRRSHSKAVAWMKFDHPEQEANKKLNANDDFQAPPLNESYSEAEQSQATQPIQATQPQATQPQANRLIQEPIKDENSAELAISKKPQIIAATGASLSFKPSITEDTATAHKVMVSATRRGIASAAQQEPDDEIGSTATIAIEPRPAILGPVAARSTIATVQAATTRRKFAATMASLGPAQDLPEPMLESEVKTVAIPNSVDSLLFVSPKAASVDTISVPAPAATAPATNNQPLALREKAEQLELEQLQKAIPIPTMSPKHFAVVTSLDSPENQSSAVQTDDAGVTEQAQEGEQASSALTQAPPSLIELFF